MKRLAQILTALALAASASSTLAQGQHTAVTPDAIVWGDCPASLPPGCQAAVLEGNPSEAVPLTLRLVFPVGYQIPAHMHPVIEHVTVLSGMFHIGIGERLDTSQGEALGPGGFVVVPENHAHYAWVTEETVIQLHSVGPWGVTYVNPEDDPRN